MTYVAFLGHNLAQYAYEAKYQARIWAWFRTVTGTNLILKILCFSHQLSVPLAYAQGIVGPYHIGQHKVLSTSKY